MLIERDSDERREMDDRRGADRRHQVNPVAMDRRTGGRRAGLSRRMYLDRRMAATSISDIL